jgi:ABC-2 type transport system permease protein
MIKFLAIIKREYLQRVRSKMFVIATVLGPLMLAFFAVIPAFIFSIRGAPKHIAIVDDSAVGLYDRVRQSILAGPDVDTDPEKERGAGKASSEGRPEQIRKAGNLTAENYEIEPVSIGNRSLGEVERELEDRVGRNQLDGYIVIPRDILKSGIAQYHARNVGDVVTRSYLADRLSRAVQEQRMIDARINPNDLREITRPIKLSTIKTGEGGGKEDSGKDFYLVLGIGFLIYITLVMYGQLILGAVVEEKETRIVEVLFSSVRAFPLMMGKLIGVSLVALTQYAIWGLLLGAFALYGVDMLAARGIPFSIQVPLPIVVYFILFFLLGYFVYATIYVLVGSIVTTPQEGGQLALPIILLLVTGFYLAVPVVGSPNSQFAFWVSMCPFFSPITMLARIVAQTPPFWEIALSLLIGLITVVLLVWLAARIYRIGMLITGKRASIPEVIRWVRQT